MSNVKPASQTEQIEDLSQENVLRFGRELPSPLAVPRVGILKRKHPDTPEEGVLPLAKRVSKLTNSLNPNNLDLCFSGNESTLATPVLRKVKFS